jgi:Capsular polysaccharide synthesis protein
MAQYKTNRSTTSSTAASAFYIFLTRELARPRFRSSFLVVTFFIMLLLRQRVMPIRNEFLGVNNSNGLSRDTPPATVTTEASKQQPDNQPISPKTDNNNTNNNNNNNNKATTVSLTESKASFTRVDNIDNINNSSSSSSIATAINTTIPRTIYIFWSSGWPADSVEVQLVRKSWEYFNPGYAVICLDVAQAEFLTDRRRYIPDSIFDKMKVQARSDVYRTLILYRHGGIWVDASLFCNTPLDHWLDLHQTDLISFVRNDNLDAQKEIDIQPWVTSWFLAAPKESYILSQVVDILSNATEQARRIIDVSDKSNKNKIREYFWWHRIVSDLARRDAYIINRIQTHFVSADPMHCRQEGYETTAPVLKRCSNNKMYSTFATAQVCCTSTSTTTTTQTALAGQSTRSRNNSAGVAHHGNQQVYRMAQAIANLTQKQPMSAADWSNFCVGWNCTMHSRNMHRIEDFKALYGNETFGKLPFLLYSD